ncbi:MAG: outer membrane beta-barrel protein [Acidobacteriota bacterium]
MDARRGLLAAGVAAAVLSAAEPVQAQPQFGIGPRVSFVRATQPTGNGAQRLSGGSVRFSGKRTAVELAVDYRAGVTGDLAERIKDFPIQASLLVYPVRAVLSPYLLAGIGWYTEVQPGPVPQVNAGERRSRKTGYHAGFGAELRVHRHVGLHGDYRYTFIGFGDPDQTSSTASTPRFIPFAEQLRLNHEGSMFTWGATFYF